MSHPNLLKYSIALALIALLPACNDSNKSTSTTTATEQTAPTGKNDVVIANGAEPESLDPQKASDGASFVIARQLFLGLVDIDDNGKTVPSMASEWNNENNKVWTFKLRDANWSDGTPITAHDFVYSLRRLTDPKTASPYGSYLVDGKVLNADAIAEGKLAPDTLGVVALDDKLSLIHI